MPGQKKSLMQDQAGFWGSEQNSILLSPRAMRSPVRWLAMKVPFHPSGIASGSR
jgi:hypothetical protein